MDLRDQLSYFQLTLKMYQLLWILLVCGFVLSGCAEPWTRDGPDKAREAKPSGLSVVKADGVVVEVPRSGALADGRAIALAEAIRDYDEKRVSGSHLKKISDPGLRDAVDELATALRDDAVDRLDLTFRVARRTSSGLDAGLLSQGQESIRKLTELISRPPTKVYVSTQITSRINGVSIQYMSAADYRKKLDEWMGYTFGQSMKIGVYMFRLQRLTGVEEPLFQKLEIMVDPLVRTLDPTGRP